MLIAVEGCGHGELDIIYDSLAAAEQQHGAKVELLIICGDFQSTRDQNDLDSLACPQKYRVMGDFQQYYTGAKRAPILTIFIGGNHEASNYLWETYYGGWVADNIYYLGMSGVIHVGGLTICGSSGIFKYGDHQKGYPERPPYSPDTQRSIYHVREFEVAKLAAWSDAVSTRPDIMLTHDWPRGVYEHGDKDGLIRYKRQFEEEVNTGTLGSPAAETLMNTLKPAYHFSGHLHVKFSALVRWGTQETSPATKFLALDKCLPGRRFLQILQIEGTDGRDNTPLTNAGDLRIYRDIDWLTVLKTSHEIFPVGEAYCKMTEERIQHIKSQHTATRAALDAQARESDAVLMKDGKVVGIEAQSWDQQWSTRERDFVETDHPQTAQLCEWLGISNKIKRDGSGALFMQARQKAQVHSVTQTREQLGHIGAGISDANRLLSELNAAPVEAVKGVEGEEKNEKQQKSVEQPAPAAAPVEDDDEFQIFVDEDGH